MGRKRKILTGIVGLGRSGWDIHVKMLSGNSDYKIVAVCDISDSRLKEAKNKLGCTCYKNYKQLLKHPGLELVVIASLSKDHFIMAKDSLNAGLNVVLEKPLAATSLEANKLKKIAENKGRILSPFYNFRFSNEFLVIQDLLSKHLIGKVYLIKRQVGYFNRRDDWQAKKSSLGGILNAAAIHHVDQVLQIVGQTPSSIWCDLKKIVSKGDAADHSKIILNFPSGVIADIEISWAQAFEDLPWVIYGDRGAIWKQSDKINIRWFKESDVTKQKYSDRSYMSAEIINWRTKEIMIKDGMFDLYYERLATAIKSRGALPVTMESAIVSIKVVEKCSRFDESKKA